MSSPQKSTETRQPEPVHLQSQDGLQTAQPPSFQPMNPQKPHPDSELSLRGGDRGGCCPGRFCFCIPCPLPCDFCII
ncbi:hypothetical protein CONLIGDRAFT_627639 [Coniochaeta ligniaria NRRL 30616]|uniref:Uncharacterized protein n=1 Tax=Coniochaeta ligniaria NRRL 30616 TaxID=1408157 RepID=A0A1J7J733_9PEZI|nr:hypothetical protein CONLIGDRAFT_627639 [Coniochaeta ligniaria NRRL 30616]